ncbi:protein phosphatase [Pseudoruegeria sp. SHC-113]|uniref:protein-tyrosine phosphatase family protein n=1 Tax=Pseudoruegeria sp. SHC-113 TaxID=2855439 RepID=UPI0021BAB284|nr:protein phosphatase [Pseudoruegeria sp. SHC-113]
MSEPFVIRQVPAGAGCIGVAPLPGRGGDLAADLRAIADFAPAFVISCTEASEMGSAQDLPAGLAAAGIGWRGFPIVDFGVPSADTSLAWPALKAEALAVLAKGGRVLAHCHGGRGRSGMVALALLTAQGQAEAFAHLRRHHPLAVETEAQRLWAERVLR